MIEMRDGEFLQADVYVPSGPGPFETILIQTPYSKENFLNLPMGLGSNVDAQPYAWVIADWRGFYGSSGAVSNGGERGEDGYDLCEWITLQTWHADRIGTWGPSALGKVQYETAFEHHPNHVCAVPLVAHPQFTYNDYFFGGVLEESKLQQLDALGYGLSPTVLANPYYSNLWSVAEALSWTPSEIHIPTLQIGGWYDINIDKMMEWYEDVRNNALLAVRDEQWLLVGPWVHGGTGIAYVGSSIQGELTYPNAAGVCDDMALDFFAYYLLDAPNNWGATDLITYYEMGSNQWASSNSATINSTSTNTIYLDDNSVLSSSIGSGSTAFDCDPNDPSPTIGGATLSTSLDQGPYDQSALLTRDDVIAFSSSELDQDLQVSGKITLDVYFESNQADGDIAVRLIDEYPDNRNMLITDGIRRMRLRNGYTASDESLITPGTVYNMVIELPFTNYTWEAGHKMKILLSGNSDSRWNVNLQNGGPMYQPGISNTATISIHHSAAYPSSITLPGNNDFLATEKITSTSLRVFPNPAQNFIVYESDHVINDVELYDLTGRKIALTHNELISKVEFEKLHPGSYIINFKGSDFNEKRTIIIQ